MSNKGINHKIQSNRSNVSHNLKNNSSNINKKKVIQEEPKTSYYLIPVFIILCIIPIIVKFKQYDPNLSKYSWFSDNTSEMDMFLFYKQRWFLIISSVIAIVTVGKVIYKRNVIRFTRIFIPLTIYAVLSIFSTMFSNYATYSLSGSFELFESLFTLLGYCMIVYYVFIFIETERDFVKIQYYLIGFAIIMSVLGIFQFLGYDFFASELGTNMIVPSKYRDYISMSMAFGAKRVYLTLFNPNYVGVYTALVTPIIAVSLLFQKKIIPIVLMAFTVIGLIICAIGSQSLAGAIGLVIAFISISIFMWRYLLKRIYVTIPIFLLLIIGMVVVNQATGHMFSDKLIKSLNSTKEEFMITEMHTEDDGVYLTTHDNLMKVQCTINDDQTLLLTAYDKNNQVIESQYDPTNCTYHFSDNKFKDIVIGLDLTDAGWFYILEGQKQYKFTNFNDDKTYYYMNKYNKKTKMVTAPSSMFIGNEQFASGRGYIWSRTIPLLKNYVLLGSGPDTFTIVFPQQDYLNLNHYGYSGKLITKPHNMYLQMWVQTGAISLIAFLIFYGMYFVSSIKLYIRGRFTNFYARFGVAVFIGTFCYMVTGLTNDSNINTAPIFWTLMGVGITLNHKVKPLIQKEVAEMKFEKDMKRVDGETII